MKWKWVIYPAYANPSSSPQGFFSKFLMGGGLKIFRPRRFPAGTKSDGGGGLAKKKNPTEAETAHLMQN